MNQHKRQQIFARLRQDNTSPKTELNYQSNYELLISVMLSAQATDVSVNKATHALFKIANTPETMVFPRCRWIKKVTSKALAYTTLKPAILLRPVSDY